jgi:hypothetical protein
MSDDLGRSRARFEASLAELRGAVEGEFGRKPRLGRWIVPVVAATVGFAVGLALKRSLPRLLPRR